MSRRRAMSTAPDNRLFIGIELEGATVKAALTSSSGQILSERTEWTKRANSDALTSQLIDILTDLKQTAEPQGKLVGAGLGVPGLINLTTNKIEVLPNLPQVSTATLYDDIMKST